MIMNGCDLAAIKDVVMGGEGEEVVVCNATSCVCGGVCVLEFI